MRIAIVKSSLQGIKGGLEKYTLKLATSFSQKGHEVFILTTDWPDAAADEFTVINLGRRSKLSFWHLLHFDNACKKWLSQNSVDCVFGFDRNFCKQHYYRAGNGSHRAFLEHRRSFSSLLKCLSFKLNPLHRLILAMEKKTFESVALKRLFTNSEMVRKEILTYYPQVDPDKIVAVHNGVEWREFQKSFDEGFSQREEIMRRLNLKSSLHQFLFIGNEYQRKGLSLLLDALSQVKVKNFELSVVGKERNIESFKKLTKKLKLEDKVFFFGQQKEPVQFYQAADTLVIPSFYDPFANVTVEALAMGLQIISSKKNGASEVITGENGSVFLNQEDLVVQLEEACRKRKTKESATKIRDSVSHLDFSNQIAKIVNLCESDFC